MYFVNHKGYELNKWCKSLSYQDLHILHVEAKLEDVSHNSGS